MILDIDRSARGPQIVLTRSHPDFLKKLFEGEVQEISEGIVQIKACSREPGDRAKIAVISTDSGVDPVGACVGVKGVRVQAVVQELRGERIDIITWTGDEPSFVARALAPAEVSRVIVDEANHTIEVVVADDQLALAIGRRGQNVKLASKLTGWRIDVRSLSVAEEESRRAKASIDAIPGIGFAEATVLFQQGFRSAAEVAESSSEELSTMEGFTEERAKAVYESALNFVESGGDKMASDDEKPLSDLYRLGLNEELMFRLISNGYNTIQALVTAQDFGGGYHSNDERHENGLSEVPRGNTLRNNPNFSDLERDLIREKLEEFLRRRPTVKFS
jgi:N utilization substance protein A